MKEGNFSTFFSTFPLGLRDEGIEGDLGGGSWWTLILLRVQMKEENEECHKPFMPLSRTINDDFGRQMGGNRGVPP